MINKTNDDGAGSGQGASWPFFVIYAVMWAGMIGTTLNTDPIKSGLTVSTVVMMPVLLAILILLTRARWRGHSVFLNEFTSPLSNLGWHVFVLTGVIFLSYLFFDGVIQMMMYFHVPVFDPGCAVSERDTALFVWDAMAKGAFKFLAKYLNIPVEACAPNASNRSVMAAMELIRWYTALVIVWHVISFARTWLKQLQSQRG